MDPRGSAQIPQGILETQILLKMRFELDQYINLRPTKLLAQRSHTTEKCGARRHQHGDRPRKTPKRLYCQNGGFLYKNTPHEVANQIEVTTRHGVERTIRYAFDYAVQFNPKKSNAGGQDQRAEIRAQPLAAGV